MDKAVELIVAKYKSIEESTNECKSALDAYKKEKTKQKNALKALGWEINSEGEAVEITASLEKEKLTQKHVREVAVTTVKENAGINRQDLETFVNDKLSNDLKLDMKGIGLRWDEVWASDMFEVDGSGVVALSGATA